MDSNGNMYTKESITKLRNNANMIQSLSGNNAIRKKEVIENKEKSETITIEELLDLGDRALGLKVVVNSSRQSTHGVVSYILPDCQRLALEKASNPHTGKIRPGLVIYLFFEILSVTIVGVDVETRKALLKLVRNEDQVGRRVLVKKIAQVHLTDHNDIEEDILLGKVAPPLATTTVQTPLPPPPPGITRASKKQVVDKIDQSFNDAISDITKENVIGLSVRGRDIGRLGSLAWINIGTSSKTYFFDVGQLSVKAVLDAGISAVLTSNAIIKIIHDSRFMADFLHHVHNVDIVNVFDIQAGAVYLHMMNHPGTVPSFLTGLPNMLVKYIGLSAQQICFTHIREECYQEDEMMWFQRPLPDRLQEEMFQSVAFLAEIRAAMLQLMLVDLTQVTNIFVSSVIDQSSATYNTIEPQIVPNKIQRLAKRSVINDTDLCDPYISYSRDPFRVITK